VVVPLIFRQGAAEVAFNVAVAAWLVFEFVMRVRQRLRASGPAAPDPSLLVLMPALVAHEASADGASWTPSMDVTLRKVA
jgi:hypothetical protein